MADDTDETLIEQIANLFIPNPGRVSDERMAELAYQAGEVFGHSRGWTIPTIRDYASRVKRRVENRLWMLSRHSASSQ